MDRVFQSSAEAAETPTACKAAAAANAAEIRMLKIKRKKQATRRTALGGD